MYAHLLHGEKKNTNGISYIECIRHYSFLKFNESRYYNIDGVDKIA